MPLSRGWIALIVLFVLSLLVNAILLGFVGSKLQQLSVLKTAVMFALTGKESVEAKLDLDLGQMAKSAALPATKAAAALAALHTGAPPSFADAPAFSTRFDTATAQFGARLLAYFAAHRQLPGATAYLYFADVRFGAVAQHAGVWWVLFRGSQTKADAQADLEFHQQHNVHSGFLRVFRAVWPSLSSVLRNATQVVVLGYSLGAAVATLVLNALAGGSSTDEAPEPSASTAPERQLVGYGFASPRVGNLVFAAQFPHRLWFNIINSDDVVPTLPLAVMPNPRKPSQPYFYEQVGELLFFTANWGTWLLNHSLAVYTQALHDEALS